MVHRLHTSALRRLVKAFPVVTLLGPRQCGKTTLARAALAKWTYLDLERPSDRAPFEADPEARLAQLAGGTVLDEAQRLPALFPVLRGVIDAEPRRAGRFLLLGSASPALIRQISESLAGRTAMLDLPTLRWAELAGPRRLSLADLWFRGGYPDACLQRDAGVRSVWFESYVRTFIERDLPALGLDVSSSQIRALLTMLAHTNGGMWNASALAASMGCSYHTVNRYVDILDQTYLVRRLQPYHANLGKRLVKSPKIVFRDSGLLHCLLGINSPKVLQTHPARGASWESFVIDQIISLHQLADPASRFYFWRTATGVEVDLLVETGGSLTPYEIKLHTAPTAEMARSLAGCMADLKLDHGYLVHAGRHRYSLGSGIEAIPADVLLARPMQEG
jgi:hypothetical protein